jgi:hypothetical protein
MAGATQIRKEELNRCYPLDFTTPVSKRRAVRPLPRSAGHCRQGQFATGVGTALRRAARTLRPCYNGTFSCERL